MTVPVIVRLQGTADKEAKAMIKESGMKIHPFGASPFRPSVLTAHSAACVGYPVLMCPLARLFRADDLDEAAAKAVEMAAAQQ